MVPWSFLQRLHSGPLIPMLCPAPRAQSFVRMLQMLPGARSQHAVATIVLHRWLKHFDALFCVFGDYSVWFRLNSKFSPQIKEQFHKTKLCVRSPANSSFENRLRDCWHSEMWLPAKFLMNMEVFNKKQKCSMGAQCPFAHSEEVREDLFEVLIDLCFIKPTKNIPKILGIAMSKLEAALSLWPGEWCGKPAWLQQLLPMCLFPPANSSWSLHFFPSRDKIYANHLYEWASEADLFAADLFFQQVQCFKTYLTPVSRLVWWPQI